MIGFFGKINFLIEVPMAFLSRNNPPSFHHCIEAIAMPEIEKHQFPA